VLISREDNEMAVGGVAWGQNYSNRKLSFWMTPKTSLGGEDGLTGF
jgi:hypothetical protein